MLEEQNMLESCQQKVPDLLYLSKQLGTEQEAALICS